MMVRRTLAAATVSATLDSSTLSSVATLLRMESWTTLLKSETLPATISSVCEVWAVAEDVASPLEDVASPPEDVASPPADVAAPARVALAAAAAPPRTTKSTQSAIFVRREESHGCFFGLIEVPMGVLTGAAGSKTTVAACELCCCFGMAACPRELIAQNAAQAAGRARARLVFGLVTHRSTLKGHRVPRAVVRAISQYRGATSKSDSDQTALGVL